MNHPDISLLTDQVISSPHFRMIIKEIFEQLSDESKSREASANDTQHCLDSVAEDIAEHMEILMREEVSRQLRISEELVRSSYELKRKEFEDSLGEMLEKEIRKMRICFEEGMESLSSTKISQISISQPRGDRQSVLQKRRNILKSMILNENHSEDSKNEADESTSFSPNSELDSSTSKLTKQVHEISQQMNRSIKRLHERIKAVEDNWAGKMSGAETKLQEQLEGSLEAIWNIISNLEKRMLSPDPHQSL